MAGEAALAGIDLDGVDACTYVDVCYAVMVRSLTSAYCPPADALVLIDKHVASLHVDRDRWGVTAEAAVGQAAFEALIAADPSSAS